jgi:hypothetical protein
MPTSPIIAGMDVRTHLSTLLSQVLVAYTIEADSEFESLMPHQTAVSRAAGEKPGGPWLISLAMWANFLSMIPDDGIPVGELSKRAGVRKLETAGMVRWGYVRVDADKVVTRTPDGQRAAEVWTPIEERVEARWRDRFGSDVIASLRSAISESVADLERVGPNFLPNVGYGLWTTEQLRGDRVAADASSTLSAALCRALTVIAVGFERSSSIALALAANALRVLDASGTPVRDIPGRAGIASEITDVSLGYLDKERLARVVVDGRARIAIPTDTGLWAKESADRRLAELDARFERVRGSLEAILENSDALADVLTPHPSAWRAAKPYARRTERLVANPRAGLPHFPIVTHRGGYPDGS